MNKPELEKLLMDIDEELFLMLPPGLPRVTVVIVGGSAFVLNEFTRRPSTHDVDVLEADERARAVISKYPELNGNVAAFADQVPYNYEDRLINLSLETKAVDYKTPCLEDLVVMKLYAWRESDIEDITSREALNKMDWELLDRLVLDPGEALASVGSRRRYDEMVHCYGLFLKMAGR